MEVGYKGTIASIIHFSPGILWYHATCSVLLWLWKLVYPVSCLDRIVTAAPTIYNF